MDSAWISAFSAVMGSLVGAFTSFVTTYANQRNQYRRDFLSRQFAQREALYSEFINEASRLMADSLEQETVKPSTLVPIYGLENRIRLNASDEVVQAARSAIREIVESWAPKNDRGGQHRFEVGTASGLSWANSCISF